MEPSRRAGRSWLGWLIGLVSFCLVLTEWIRLLGAPVTSYRTDHSISRTLGDLIQGNHIYEYWLEGYVFIALSLLLIIIILISLTRALSGVNNYIDASQVALSMLETHVKIKFVLEDLSVAEISREQLFHANNNRVQAYHYSHIPNLGRIDRQSFFIQTCIDDKPVTYSQECMPVQQGRGIEVIETFDDPLPTNFFVTYLPDEVVIFLFRQLGLFKSIIARREVKFKSIDEYNHEDPVFQLQLQRYPANLVSLVLIFPIGKAPGRNDITLLRIREVTVQSVPVHRYEEDNEHVIVEFRVSKASLERLRVKWNNPNRIVTPSSGSSRMISR